MVHHRRLCDVLQGIYRIWVYGLIYVLKSSDMRLRGLVRFQTLHLEKIPLVEQTIMERPRLYT